MNRFSLSGYLSRWIDRFIPSAPVSIEHPLFKLEPASVRQLLVPDKLRRQTMIIVIVIFLLTVVYWLLADKSAVSRGAGIPWDITDNEVLLIFVSLIAGPLVETACLLASINSFQMKDIVRAKMNHTVRAKWELLYLTPVTSEDIVAVKYVSSLVRVWSVVAAIAGFRLAALAIPILDWISSGGWQDFPKDILGFVAMIPVIVMACLYITAPFWQARLMVVACLTESTYHSNGILIGFLALIPIAIFWFKSILVITSICFFTFVISFMLMLMKTNEYIIALFFCLMLALALWIFRNFYRDAHSLLLDHLPWRLEKAI